MQVYIDLAIKPSLERLSIGRLKRCIVRSLPVHIPEIPESVRVARLLRRSRYRIQLVHLPYQQVSLLVSLLIGSPIPRKLPLLVTPPIFANDSLPFWPRAKGLRVLPPEVIGRSFGFAGLLLEDWWLLVTASFRH